MKHEPPQLDWNISKQHQLVFDIPPPNPTKPAAPPLRCSPQVPARTMSWSPGCVSSTIASTRGFACPSGSISDLWGFEGRWLFLDTWKLTFS